MALLSHLPKLIAAAALTFATLAPAAYADRGDRRGGHHYGDRGDYRGHHNGYRGRGHYGRGHHDRGYRGHYRGSRYSGYSGYSSYYRPSYRYVAPRSYSYTSRSYYSPRPVYSYSGYSRSYSPRYSVGGHYSYTPNTVYISDYNRYGLYNPPHGYRWVHDRNSGDAILASVATGAIIGLFVGAISQ